MLKIKAYHIFLLPVRVTPTDRKSPAGGGGGSNPRYNSESMHACRVCIIYVSKEFFFFFLTDSVTDLSYFVHFIVCSIDVQKLIHYKYGKNTEYHQGVIVLCTCTCIDGLFRDGTCEPTPSSFHKSLVIGL